MSDDRTREENCKVFLVKSLAETIFWAKKCYYNGMPTLNDEAYDKIEYELQKLCPNHPIIQKAVGDVDFDFLFGVEATRMFVRQV